MQAVPVIASASGRARRPGVPGERRRGSAALVNAVGYCLSLGVWLAAPMGVAAAPDRAVTVDAGLTRCAELRDAQTRLACFDALAARRAIDTQTPMTAASRPMSAPMSAATQPRAALPTTDPLGEASEREVLAIRPYRSNYLLPVAYNANPNRNVAAAERLDIPFLEGALDDVEMKFQLSFEVPLWARILQRDLDLYFAYTQLAFFQAYNREYSSPFRETNYEPELGLNWQPDVEALGWRLGSARLAVNHQSNGRSEPLSRSWNRLLLQVDGERDGLALGLRLWALLGDDPSDNPDIAEYLGYGELHATYRLGQHELGAMLRNPRHPTVQLDWSYPLGRTLRLYLQYFNGYGESLLDYDHSVNRVGLGFMLNGWP